MISLILVGVLTALQGNLGISFGRASARRILAEPGRRGFCWRSCGAQPVTVMISNVAGTRPSGSAKRS